MRKAYKIFDNLEPILFLILTLVNLLPVLLVRYFPTVDGPAHLYNSKLMAELFSDPNGILGKYFSVEKLIPTNLTDHYFFLITGYFLPGFLSEKLIMLFYLAGLPYAYRYFIRSIAPGGIYLSWFIFPFTYSFLFFYGFFNFSIALVFFFITLPQLKKLYSNFSVLHFITFTILTLMVCISHAFVFIILILYLIVFMRQDLFHMVSKHSQEMKDIAIRKISLVAWAIAPAFLLIIISSIKTHSFGSPFDYFDFSILLKWIRQIQPAKGILYHREDIYTTWLFYLLVLLTALMIYNMIFDRISVTKGRIKVTLNRKKKNIPDNLLLIVTLAIFAMYFIIPDGFRSYSFISSRLLVFFFLFLIAWIASGYMQPLIKITAVLMIIIMNSFLLGIYITESKKLNLSACELEKASDIIPANSVVLPVNRSDKWIYGHFSNYLGINKPLIILENYEAELDYFPTSWNDEMMPRFLFGQTDSISHCLKWKSQTKNTPRIVDFVLLINNPEIKDDTCTTKINKILNKYYMLLYRSYDSEIELYSIKPERDRNNQTEIIEH
jgi:hypothetical protein